MSYLLTPKEELINRVKKLQNQLLIKEVNGVLLTKNVDIYYYSGTMQNSMMFIPSNNEPILFVKKSLDRAKSETPFSVEELGNIKNLPNQIQGMGNTITSIGIEMDVIPYNLFQKVQRAFSESKFIDISNTILIYFIWILIIYNLLNITKESKSLI